MTIAQELAARTKPCVEPVKRGMEGDGSINEEGYRVGELLTFEQAWEKYPCDSICGCKGQVPLLDVRDECRARCHQGKVVKCNRDGHYSAHLSDVGKKPRCHCGATEYILKDCHECLGLGYTVTGDLARWVEAGRTALTVEKFYKALSRFIHFLIDKSMKPFEAWTLALKEALDAT